MSAPPDRRDILLGNPEVVLRNSGGNIVKRGPTAQDLSDAPAGDYIDLQGKPLSGGCFYEKWATAVPRSAAAGDP